MPFTEFFFCEIMNKSLEPLLFLKSALIYRHSFYNITKVLDFLKNADAFIFLVFAASAKNNPHYVNAENQSKWHYQSFAQIYSLRIHFEGTGQNEVVFSLPHTDTCDII